MHADHLLDALPVERRPASLGIQECTPHLVYAAALDLRYLDRQSLDLVHASVEVFVGGAIGTLAVLSVVLEVVGGVL